MPNIQHIRRLAARCRYFRETTRRHVHRGSFRALLREQFDRVHLIVVDARLFVGESARM